MGKNAASLICRDTKKLFSLCHWRCVVPQAAERSARTEENTWPAEGAPAHLPATTEPAGQDTRHPAHRHRRQGEHSTGRLQRSQHSSRLHPHWTVRRRRVRHAPLSVRLPPAAKMLSRRQRKSQVIVACGLVLLFERWIKPERIMFSVFFNSVAVIFLPTLKNGLVVLRL